LGDKIEECEHCNSYGEYALDKCPYKYFKHLEATKFVRLYDRYSKGFLPYAGGELDQPWRLIYNFNLFDEYKLAWKKIWQEE
jgi:hypothetical protein